MSRFFSFRAGGLLATLLGFVALSAPSTAAADASVDVPGDTCYASWSDFYTQKIPIKANGLKAGLAVRAELRIGKEDQPVRSTPALTVDSRGRVITELKDWTTGFEPGDPVGPNDAHIVIVDFYNGYELARTPVTVAQVGLWIDGTPVLGKTPRPWIMSGMTLFGGGGTYYAHYFKKHSVKKGFSGEFSTVRLGRPSGPCGYLKVIRPLGSETGSFRLGKFFMAVQPTKHFTYAMPFEWYTITGKMISLPAG